MSHDLFAAFAPADVPKASETGQGRQATSLFVQKSRSPPAVALEDTVTHQLGTGNVNEDDDDDFGDFEDASVPDTQSVAPTPAPKRTTASVEKRPVERTAKFPPKAAKKHDPVPRPSVGKHPFADHMDMLFAADDDEYDAGTDELGDLSSNPEAAMAFSKRMIAEQEARSKKPVPLSPDVSQSSATATAQSLPERSRNVPTRGRAKSPHVLSDVDNLSEDEFGDFEAGMGPKHDLPKTNEKTGALNVDLLGTRGSPASASASVRNGAVPQNKMSSDSRSAVATRGPPHTSPSDRMEQDDAWDDFEAADLTSLKDVLSQGTILRNISVGSTPRTNQDDRETLPHTNIPPPAILLSIFPSLLNSAHDALFDPLAKLDFASRQQLLAHPATHMFLRGYLNMAVVLGHIIAGRKLRWKRDQFLAQAMRIGPAGGKSGMKLTGIDRTELAKETREVLDTVRLWQAQVGKLRGAVTNARSASREHAQKLHAVPEIAEQMPVKTLPAAEGGITAVHACALCGLKRDERVAKVDVEVDDSFGEWWMQGMNMHLSCHGFWEEHKEKLKSR